MKFTIEAVEEPYFKECEYVNERIYKALKEKMIEVLVSNIDKFMHVSSCESYAGFTRFLATVEIVDFGEEDE